MLGSTLLIALAKRGHNVTMLSPYGLEENVDNYTHINTEELVVKEKEVTDNIIKAKEEDKLHIIVKYIKEITHKTLRHPHVRDLLTNKANRFDAIAIDGLGAETMLALSHHFHAPIVLLSLIGDMPWYGQYTGNFYPLSYVPTVESVDLKTFAGRLRNFVMGFWNLIALGWPYDETIKELIFEYFPDAPPLTQLRKDVALVLLNSHFTYETPRPYAPKSVQIGGFNLVNRKPIPADLLMWLDGAGDGVVLVSYGSKIKGYAFDGEKIEIFLDTFAKLRQKVLWKFDVREVKELTGIERIPGNVRLEKWIPQKEVLGEDLHDKRKMDGRVALTF